MKRKQYSFIEATFFIIIVIITHIISDLPNDIIEHCGSASILNVLYIFALIVIYFLIVNKLFMPFENGNILNVAEFVGGPFLKKMLSLIYISYLIFTSGILIRGFSENLKIVYFPKASISTIILCFILATLIASRFGTGSIIKANTLIVPQILISIIMTFLSSIRYFNYNSIFPVLGFGIKETFLTGSENIYAFAGLIYIYLIRPALKDIKEYKKIGIASIVISGIYLLFSVASILMLFPYLTAGKETLSVYLSTRTVEFGRFLQRSDAMFMFIWIFTFLSYLSVILCCVLRLSKEGFGIFNTTWHSHVFCLLIFIVALLPQNVPQIEFLEHKIYKYVALVVIFLISFSVLLIGYLKKKRLGQHLASKTS